MATRRAKSVKPAKTVKPKSAVDAPVEVDPSAAKMGAGSVRITAAEEIDLNKVLMKSRMRLVALLKLSSSPEQRKKIQAGLDHVDGSLLKPMRQRAWRIYANVLREQAFIYELMALYGENGLNPDLPERLASLAAKSHHEAAEEIVRLDAVLIEWEP